MKCEEIIEAAPSPEMKAKVFYHGCPNEEKAKQIAIHGIQPQDPSIKGQKPKGMMTPVTGMVYLTQNLRYAVIYALGGDFIGHTMSERFYQKDGKFGYLFVISGDQLSDIQPDEDSIGEFFYTRSGKDYSHGIPKFTPISNTSDERILWNFIFNNLTDTQRKKITQGEYAYFAAGGKRVLKNMPDDMKTRMLSFDSHIANRGGIIPSQIWKIDKTRSAELEKDCNNFFEIAERVR